MRGSMKKIARDQRDLDTHNGTSRRDVYAYTRRTIPPLPHLPRHLLLSLTHNRVPLTHRGVRQQPVGEKKR